MEKTERQFDLCRGAAIDKPDCGARFFAAWEQGRMGATAPDSPVLVADWECESKAVRRRIGGTTTKRLPIGDKLSQALATIGVTEERVAKWLGGSCGCGKRREKLNQLGEWIAKLAAEPRRKST